MAVARLALAGDLAAIAGEPALAELAVRHGFAGLLAVRAAVDHAAAATPREVGEMFDAAVAACAEASVAAVSLGDAGLLARGADEIVAWLLAEGVLAPGMRVLDLGCGIGRVAAALAPVAGAVLGLDVSARMVAQARRRVVAPNLCFAVTDGTGLPPLPFALDLVLAVDCFPYLVQAAVAERHVAQAAEVLVPGGSLVVLNWSYRGLAQDREEAACWAARHGLALARAGDAPFQLWDGSAFVLTA